MEPQELFNRYLEGTIYEAKQVDEHGVHLTVARILHPIGAGRTDFGGDEQQECPAREIAPKKLAAEDEYGWWDLEAGQYRIGFNEALLPGAGTCLLVANRRLLACGCALAATLVHEGSPESVLTVPQVGVSIKQNARVALLRPLK